MGILDNLFKPRSQSDDEARRSAQIMERLKQRRGQETGKWLALMEGASKAPPPVGPPPTIEDVDKRETLDEAPYSPPLETQFISPDDEASPNQIQAIAGSSAQTQQPASETVEWVNGLFSEFEYQAADYNASAAGTQLMLFVHLPEFSYESPRSGQEYGRRRKISIFNPVKN